MPNRPSIEALARAASATHLSPHFSRREMACPCCGWCEVDPALVAGLESLRASLGKPITITSACRCRAHNAAVGGAANSQHVAGKAADVQVAGMTARALYAAARGIPQFRAFGIADQRGFLHVDTRQVAARWCYRAGKQAPWQDEPITA